MSGPVRWGFLSTAKINALLLTGAEPSERVDIVAVASRDLERAEAYARERRIERVHGSYEALLKDADVQVVHNATPNYLHYPINAAAIAQGKHVVSDKPLAMTASVPEFSAPRMKGRSGSEPAARNPA
jgi:D-xylose 1-dehydrogenase (NADP+, D-xylono-1,5-lactone-forming)